MSGMVMLKKERKSKSSAATSLNRPARQENRMRIPTQLKEGMEWSKKASYLPRKLGIVVQQKLGVIRSNVMCSGGVQHPADEGGTGKRVAIVQRTADNVVQKCGGVGATASSTHGTGTGAGTSSELDWNAVLPRSGETRVAHVKLHEKDDPSKYLHGIFTGDAVSTINEAWKRRGSPTTIGDTDIYIIPYANVGTEGGYAGSGAQLHHVKIVTQKGTNNIITGFPVKV